MIIGGAAQSRYNSNHYDNRQVVADCCSVCHKSREPRASGRVRETAMRTGRDRSSAKCEPAAAGYEPRSFHGHGPERHMQHGARAVAAMLLLFHIILLVLFASSRCNAFTPENVRQQCASQRRTLSGHAEASDEDTPDERGLEIWDSQKEQLAKALSRSMEEIEKITAHHPNLLRSSVNQTIVPKVDLLQTRLGFTRKEARRIASNQYGYYQLR